MLDYLHADDDLWVIDKPSNTSLLRDRSGAPDLWQALKAQADKPYLVHRLDKGTSGVLLIARTQAMQTRLTRLFEQRAVGKFYVARVVGNMRMGVTIDIDLPLCRGRKSRYRVAGERDGIERVGRRFSVAQDRDGLAARTLVRVLKQDRETSWILAKPLTGRTHQLRVHLSWIGWPIVGDHLYGKPKDPRQTAQRMMLHCHRLVVPGVGAFVSPLPQFARSGAEA